MEHTVLILVHRKLQKMDFGEEKEVSNYYLSNIVKKILFSYILQ